MQLLGVVSSIWNTTDEIVKKKNMKRQTIKFKYIEIIEHYKQLILTQIEITQISTNDSREFINGMVTDLHDYIQYILKAKTKAESRKNYLEAIDLICEVQETIKEDVDLI